MIVSLVAEFGIFRAIVSNWVRSYREECQNNDEEKSQLDGDNGRTSSSPVRKVRVRKGEQLKKVEAFFAKGID